MRVKHRLSNLNMTHEDIAVRRKPQQSHEATQTSHRDYTGKVPRRSTAFNTSTCTQVNYFDKQPTTKVNSVSVRRKSRVPACLVGVKSGSIHLCWVAGNTGTLIISHSGDMSLQALVRIYQVELTQRRRATLS